jgi:hypothetical protein
MTIGSRKTVPPRMLRIVPLGESHTGEDGQLASEKDDHAQGSEEVVLFFKLNSFTRASSGVMVAHFTPTEYFLIVYEPVLDVLPDDPGHLISVQLHQRAFYFDFPSTTGNLSSLAAIGVPSFGGRF